MRDVGWAFPLDKFCFGSLVGVLSLGFPRLGTLAWYPSLWISCAWELPVRNGCLEASACDLSLGLAVFVLPGTFAWEPRLGSSRLE